MYAHLHIRDKERERKKTLKKDNYVAWIHFRTKGWKWVSNLSSVKRFVSGVVIVEEEHVDKGDEEAGSILGGARIV